MAFAWRGRISPSIHKASLAALAGTAVVFGLVAGALADVLRCEGTPSGNGGAFALVVRDDLGAELRIGEGGASSVCPLRLAGSRYCPECHVPLVELHFTPNGSCEGAKVAAGGLRDRIEFHARLHLDNLDKTSVIYRSLRVAQPCDLIELQAEKLGFPKELSIPK